LNIDQIVTQLKSERDRLDRAIAALEGTVAGRGKPASSGATAARRRRAGPRQISAAARRRMSQMMKQRWAARKKAGKSRL